MGADGFRARAQLIDRAQRTLDLQYYIFRGDETGRMLTDHLAQAADRGVRIRILIDDGDSIAGDEQVLRLLKHHSVELRIFNPAKYRGHVKFVRRLEFVLNKGRLDYRMHNKLLVADNAAALIGGRNIGNQYFQVDPDSQFADDDVFAVGQVVPELSRVFDEFWNSDLAIPAEALGRPHRESPAPKPEAGGIDYAALLAKSDPFSGILSGELPLSWAPAQLVYDSPDKKRVLSGAIPGALIVPEVEKSIRSVQSEMLLVTPYMVPTADELQALEGSASTRRQGPHSHQFPGVVSGNLRAVGIRQIPRSASQERRGAARGSRASRELSRQRAERQNIALRQLCLARQAVCF